MTRRRAAAARVWRYLRYERRALRDRPIATIQTDAPVPGDAVRWLGDMDIHGERHAALFCHPRAAVTFRWRASSAERLTVFCTLLPDAWTKNTGGVEFRLRAGADGLDTHASATLRPGTRTGDRRWRRLTVALPAAARDVELTLETRVPEGATPDFAWAAWGDPAIERARPVREIVRLLRAGVRQGGWLGAARALAAAAATDERVGAYRRWADARTPDAAALAAMRSASEQFAYRPVISVITPVYNTDPQLLEACIASVMAQAYPDWELCLCDDGSTSAATLDVLKRQSDPRIKVAYLASNARISAASNGALALATGDFIALLDHDDELTPDALFEMVRQLNASPDTDVLYSDEDKLDEDGGLSEPFFKPCWSPEHLLSAMYTCHLTVARRALVQRIGGFRLGYEGAQDHDLMLRLSDVTPRIAHVPKILYHWRRTPESTASAGSAKPWADDAGQRALGDYLRRNQIAGDVVSGGVPGLYRVKFAIAGSPAVTVIVAGDSDVPEDDAALRAATEYANVDVVQVRASPATLVSRINAAARASRGTHVVVLDAGLRPLTGEWLTAMLEYSQQPAIGAVGARIEYADGRLRHIGMVACVEGGPAAAFDGAPGESYGYFSSAIGVRNYAAVSGECLMTRRDVFDEVGGFDESRPWRGADVDYCVRVRRDGRRVVFTPYARLQWTGEPGGTRVAAPPIDDPYYNPNLARASADYSLGD